MGSGWVDYGPQREYEVLKRECVEADQAGHQYKLCFFQNFTRSAIAASGDTGGEGQVLLGRFKKWGREGVKRTVHEAHYSDKTDEAEADSDKSDTATEQELADLLLKKGQSNSWLDAVSKRFAGSATVERRNFMLESIRSQPNYWTHQTYSEGGDCRDSRNTGINTHSAEVALECGTSLELVEVLPYDVDGSGESEAKAEAHKAAASSCAVRVRVKSPIACTSDVEQASLDELNRLGVFGFTKKTSKAAVRKSVEDSVAAQKAKKLKEAESLQAKRAKMDKEKRERMDEGELESEQDKKDAIKEGVKRQRQKEKEYISAKQKNKTAKKAENIETGLGNTGLGSGDSTRPAVNQKLDLPVLEEHEKEGYEIDDKGNGAFHVPDDMILIGGVLRPKEQKVV